MGVGPFLLIDLLLFAKLVRSLNYNDSNSDIQSEIVEDFKRLCPYTGTCRSKASENLTDSGELVACCRHCSCDVNCGTACCPDKPERFLNVDEINELKNQPEQCVLAQIREFDSNKLNGKAYKMIGHCPENYSNAIVKEKCSLHYHDFDFEKGDFKTLMPVTVEQVNVTFRNYFCAACHNALNAKLLYWNIKSVCKNKKKLLLTSLSEILPKLSGEPSCQVIFEPLFSVGIIGVKLCSSEIDRCNSTGKWKQYDRSIEIACLSYTSVYYGYKNIHCFLCNGHTIQETTTACKPEDSSVKDKNSFVDMLDFYNIISSAIYQQEIKCPGTSIYDPIQKVCRKLYCAKGMMLSGDKCSPQYSEQVYLDHNIVFNLKMNLIPSHIARNGNFKLLLQFMRTVFNDLRSNLDLIQTAEDAKICAFNAYLKLNDSHEGVIMSMKRHKLTDFVQFISHISIKMDSSLKGIANISSVVEEMAMLYTTNDFHAQYQIQYLTDDEKMPGAINASLGDKDIQNLDEIGLDPLQYKMLLHGINDPYDGFGKLWFDNDQISSIANQKCDSAVTVQPKPFCPRIELYRKEFDIDSVNKRVISVQNDVSLSKFSPYLTFTMMMTRENDNSVIVCAEEYFTQLYTVKEEEKSDEEYYVLSAICLACSAFSLALTFVVYCILPSLRTLPGLNTMSLVFHLFIAHILMFINSIVNIQLSWLCSALAIITHYNYLASFFWMFICTFHMLKVFVKINEKISSTHSLSKWVHYLVFTESLSAILVTCSVIVAVVVFDDSTNFGFGSTDCFLQNVYLLVYFFLAPLLIVLFVNIGMFVYVMCRVVRLPDMSDSSNRERNTVVIFAKLSSLTGITWILGFIPQSIFFKYVSLIFIAGQGVFIMLSFVVNKRVLNLLRSEFKDPKHEINEAKSRIITVSVSNDNGKIHNIK